MDNEKIALVVIDMQKGIAALDRKIEPYGIAKVRENVGKLIVGFRKFGAKVFLVHVTGTDGKDMLKPVIDNPQPWGNAGKDWAEFIEEAKPADNDIVITKRQWGAFYGTELDLQLRRRKIDTIVLCGIATNIGVETTAREAYQHGYNQIFAEDAMGAMSKEEHDATVRFIFPKIGIIRKTDEIMKMIGQQ